jgi:predicted tellurium resistance membrane protein TerC
MQSITSLLADPGAWAAFATLVVMEVVLGVDNLVFVSILSNRLPPDQQTRARRIGIGLALILRLALLATISWLVGLTKPVIDLGLHGPLVDGHPAFETAFSLRDLILLAGGLFLIWKATKEIHHTMASDEDGHGGESPKSRLSFGSAIAQIIALDIVFSIDSILTAVGMTSELPIMIAAVVIAVGLMMVAADPLARFIAKNPTVVMLALGFLLMIGAVLIADAFGVHIPKGYIYAAMAFSGGVEALNMAARKRKAKKH